jgi:hypothetical protein
MLFSPTGRRTSHKLNVKNMEKEKKTIEKKRQIAFRLHCCQPAENSAK